MSRELISEFRVANMEHEMYNDGLYFIEQVIKETNYGDQQRCIRLAIVCFASSFESFINHRLKHVLQNNVTKIQNGQAILDFLTHGFNSASSVPRELRTIANKLKTLEAILGLNSNLLFTNDFIIFDNEVIKLRNMIVHYSHGNFNNVYKTNLEIAANDGAKLLVNAITSICNIANFEIPGYYLRSNYEAIK